MGMKGQSRQSNALQRFNGSVSEAPRRMSIFEKQVGDSRENLR